MIAEIDRVPAIAFVHGLLPSADNLLQLREFERTRLHRIGRIAPVQIMPTSTQDQLQAIEPTNARSHFELEDHLQFILPDVLNEDLRIMGERSLSDTVDHRLVSSNDGTNSDEAHVRTSYFYGRAGRRFSRCDAALQIRLTERTSAFISRRNSCILGLFKCAVSSTDHQPRLDFTYPLAVFLKPG